MKLEGDELRKEIDEALAEIDRVSEDMLELFADLLGPHAARRVAAYMAARAADPSLDLLRRASLSEPSKPPQGTR